MPFVNVKCQCKTCGSFFEKSVKCNSLDEKENCIEYALDQYTECHDCRQSRIEKEKEEKFDEFIKNNLPEITGSSDKQIRYAFDLRNRYLSDHQNEIVSMKDAIEKAKNLVIEKYNGNIDKFSLDSFYSFDHDIRVILNAPGLSRIIFKIIKLCMMSNARDIIDALTY